MAEPIKEEIKRPKCIDLFAGAGGFTLGFALAGFDVVGHIEYEEYALKTYELNAPNYGFGNSELIGKDITKITDEQIRAFAEKHGHIHTIIGGPPCQSFSLSGRREINDPRDNLFLHYVRFVNIIRPDSFILENVLGMLSKKNDKGEWMIDVIQEAFKIIGYENRYAILNAVNYSVPQTRRRVFIMGSRTGKSITLPLPVNFGKEEGKVNVDKEKDSSAHHYRKCTVCGKHYASYTFNDIKEPVCLFCCHHQDNPDKTFSELSLKEGWLVVREDIPVPAKTEDMYKIRYIEKRSDLTGVSTYLYVNDINNDISWLMGTRVRHIADDDKECNNAEAWIMHDQIIRPISKALNQNTSHYPLDTDARET